MRRAAGHGAGRRAGQPGLQATRCTRAGRWQRWRRPRGRVACRSALLMLLRRLRAGLAAQPGHPRQRRALRGARHPPAWRCCATSPAPTARCGAMREGGLSLAVTTLFWGVGATLQFAVLRWAQDHLGLPLDQAAYLQAAVAVGVVAGAARPAAGCRWPARAACCLRRRARPADAGGGADAQRVAGGAAADAGRRRRRPAGGAAERAAAAPRLRAAHRRPVDRRAGLQRERQRPGHAGASMPR